MNDPTTLTHPLNYQVGWSLILAGFASGALLGLWFHRAGFWGGYGSFQRRLARLGHIALVALGVLNLLYACAPGEPNHWGSLAFVVGGIAMPAVCFLTAWRPWMRHAFFLPVCALAYGALTGVLS